MDDRRVRVKICGLTSVDDARAAVEAGADWLGFNFYAGSPRYITPDACSHIVGQLEKIYGEGFSGVTLVGVFVNTGAEDILSILDQCRLDLAQLSGDESPALIPALAGRGYKAVRTTAERDLENAAAPFIEAAQRAGLPLLVDASAPGAYGGTGRLADWQQARALAACLPVVLAGGLTAENVAEAVAAVRPWGVDVASGVELAPGKKDVNKMRRFVEAARSVRVEAECEQSNLFGRP